MSCSQTLYSVFAVKQMLASFDPNLKKIMLKYGAPPLYERHPLGT